MIPAVLWGGAEERRAGRRAVWFGGAWVVVWRDGANPAAFNIEARAHVLKILNTPPDDAWRGTAGELLKLIAPVSGAHCDRCADTAKVPCAACDGTNIGCTTCDGALVNPCDCAPEKAAAVAVRGRAYSGQLLRMLRGVLHHVGEDAPASLWTLVLDGTTPTLIVDADGHRFALASMVDGYPATHTFKFAEEVSL